MTNKLSWNNTIPYIYVFNSVVCVARPYAAYFTLCKAKKTELFEYTHKTTLIQS